MIEVFLFTLFLVTLFIYTAWWFYQAGLSVGKRIGFEEGENFEHNNYKRRAWKNRLELKDKGYEKDSSGI